MSVALSSQAPVSRALVTTAHGGPEVVQVKRRPRPAPAPGEVRIRLVAAALNHLDLWVRRGIPAGHWPVPIVPCADGAGVVDALGEGVQGLEVGDEVVLYPVRSCGACRACRAGDPPHCKQFGMLGEHVDGCAQEHLIVPAGSVLPKPDGLEWAAAAALPTTFLTAWRMLATTARLQPGETVVVHGARSGVGSAGIQVARQLGAFVIATARRDADLEQARVLGADAVLRSDDPEWSRQARALCPGGVDVVFEHIGGELFSSSIRALRRGGRLVTCGATAGHRVELDLRKIFFHSIAVLGSTMGSLSELETLLTLAGRGLLVPEVGARFPLERGAEAMQALESREHFGKIVLEIDDARVHAG